MGSRQTADRLLTRLHADVARAVGTGEPSILAFSGGLASLVLAAVARKHGELRCVVVGMRGSADVAAALLARDFLDHPVEALHPTNEALLRAARAVRAGTPRIAAPEVLSMVPLALVEARYPAARVLSGFGLAPRSSLLQRRLLAAPSPAPGLRRPRSSPPSREGLMRLARGLGLPDAFVRAPRRTPAEGSGIGPAMRALAYARRESLARFLDAVV